jgi:hypothetical protein
LGRLKRNGFPLVKGFIVRLRALATTTLAATLLVGTAGCGVLLEPATLQSYSPSDGVNAEVGDVSVRNALLVANSSGDGALVMTFVNSGDALVFVNVELRGARNLSASVAAYPGITKVGIADDNPLVFTNAEVFAGTYAEVYFQYGNFEGALATVPVLDGTEVIYAPYAPNERESN